MRLLLEAKQPIKATESNHRLAKSMSDINKRTTHLDITIELIKDFNATRNKYVRFECSLPV